MGHIDIATESDIPQLCKLLGILFSQEAEFSPDAETQEQGLRKIIGNPETGEILVIREKAKISGMASLLYSVSTALGRRVAMLEDVVVLPDQRSTGLGTALLQATVAHARENGCARITLLTDGDNTAGQRFYERCGFTKSAMIAMHRLI